MVIDMDDAKMCVLKQEYDRYEDYCNQLFKTYNPTLHDDTIINDKYCCPVNDKEWEDFLQIQADNFDGSIHTINVETEQE